MLKIIKTKYILALFTLTLLSAGMSMPLCALANDNLSVYDEGNYLTEQQRNSLEAAVADYEQEGNIDIIFMTAQNLPQYQCIRYMEDFFDSLCDTGQSGNDAALILYASDSEGKYLEIQGYGRAEYFINNARIEAILDKVSSDFRAGNLPGGFLSFAEESARYMNRAPKKDSIFYNPLLHLAASLLTGGIVVGIMAARSGGKVTTNNTTYLDKSHSGIIASKDQYIRTSVTKRKKPQQNSGGGHGGVSRGGRSHSGGGRRL